MNLSPAELVFSDPWSENDQKNNNSLERTDIIEIIKKVIREDKEIHKMIKEIVNKTYCNIHQRSEASGIADKDNECDKKCMGCEFCNEYSCEVKCYYFYDSMDHREEMQACKNCYEYNKKFYL